MNERYDMRKALWVPALVAGSLVFCASYFVWPAAIAAMVGLILAFSLVWAAASPLEKSRPRNQTFAESLPQILWTEDAMGHLTFLNRRWSEYTGLPNSAFENEGWLQSVHPAERAESFRTWKEAAALGIPVEREQRMRSGNEGAYRWYRMRAWPRKNEKGKVLSWAGSFCDIQELRSARTERDDALRARDEFLAIASHELRTPLTSLRLKAQTILRSLERGDPAAHSPERVKDFSAHADKQVSRLSRLIEDMLEVSRLRHGEMDLHPEATDFTAAVRKTVESLRAQFRSAHCELKFKEHEPGRALAVKADPARLEQVVNNLLTNALRYGRSQPVEVEVEAEDDFAVVRVSDHGIGISLENQRKVFNRFDRAISANEISGLGLGLFITNQIVTAHGGQVRLRSEPGIGSVFELRFPILRKFQPGQMLEPAGDPLEREMEEAHGKQISKVVQEIA